MENFEMKNLRVSKLGTNLVTKDGLVDADAISGYARGLIGSFPQDQHIIVTSGAVETGKQKAERKYGSERAGKMTLQQCAALGMTEVFKIWEKELEEMGRLAISLDITHRQLNGRRWWHKYRNNEERDNFFNLIEDNGESGIDTVVNESALSLRELMKIYVGGENDGMGSHIAVATGATILRIYKEAGGVYDDDGQLIEVVNRHNIDSVRAMAEARSKSNEGTGGLSAGVNALWTAAQAGVDARMSAVSEDMTGRLETRFVVG